MPSRTSTHSCWVSNLITSNIETMPLTSCAGSMQSLAVLQSFPIASRLPIDRQLTSPFTSLSLFITGNCEKIVLHHQCHGGVQIVVRLDRHGFGVGSLQSADAVGWRNLGHF